jgi:hypothetical protein
MRKKLKLTSVGVIVILLISYFVFQQHEKNRELERKIAKYRTLVLSYENRGKSCFIIDGSQLPNFQNNVRSKERIESVSKYYTEIIRAKCFINSEGTIFTNPYKALGNADWNNISENPLGNEILQGVYFDVDLGMPFLRTGGSICSDGSYSPSVGRGTCSWHGGYGRQRGEKFEFQSAKPVYDPRRMLKILTQ